MPIFIWVGSAPASLTADGILGAVATFLGIVVAALTGWIIPARLARIREKKLRWAAWIPLVQAQAVLIDLLSIGPDGTVPLFEDRVFARTADQVRRTIEAYDTAVLAEVGLVEAYLAARTFLDVAHHAACGPAKPIVEGHKGLVRAEFMLNAVIEMCARDTKDEKGLAEARIRAGKSRRSKLPWVREPENWQHLLRPLESEGH